MTTPSSSIGIPSSPAANRRRISSAAIHDLETPRPPGGWNSLERFASSYHRSTTFFRLDATGSPASSVPRHGTSFRPRIPDFGGDAAEHAVADDDEETALLSSRGSRRSTYYRGSEAGGDYDDHFAQFRGAASPKLHPGLGVDDGYETVRMGSRRASLLVEGSGPELLIKEVEDESGNIIEVVIGQVVPRLVCSAVDGRARRHRRSSIRLIFWWGSGCCLCLLHSNTAGGFWGPLFCHSAGL